MKIKTVKFSKEARLAGETPMRRTPAQPSGLYLLALRSHTAQAGPLVSRPKLVIRIEPKGIEEGQAEPVRINHA